jgi:2-C-methyl-D-erythritol 2,4-cyclodiphosphate synthase
MKARIGEVLGVEAERIGIKATTAEKLGALGRGEGIFASATVLLIGE